MNPLPVRADKIDPPYVRPDTLSRRRLNSWLDRAARGRVAVVIGDTGFGKTTFLGDWSSQTPRCTSWYRLERDDRDWLTLIRHLVAGGRKVEAGFAPDTYRLLCTLGPGGPTQDEVVEALAREMAEFGATSQHGFSLILDDYQAIEGSAETDPIISALLQSTGNGFSIILAARSEPHLPPAHLKGRHAIQRLEGDELRFDVPETEALFREAYGIPLDHDVAVDLVARTEGWAALLSLVRTRLEERPAPDPRALVAQLSATEGDLYDFLAEEVLAEAPADLADFLAEVSILDEVTIPAAKIVAGNDAPITRLLREGESLGLLQRIAGADRWRFVPLVREFLYAHLEQTRGRRHVRELHQSVAAHFEGDDWLLAARQYVLAGRPEDAAKQVAESLDAVLGIGAYRVALDLLSESPDDGAVTSMLRARSLLELGASRDAIEAAQAAIQLAEGNEPEQLAAALRNATTVAIGIHDLRAAMEYGIRAIASAPSPSTKRLAECELALLSVGGSENLPAFALRLEQLRATHERTHQTHYEAITLLNLALLYIWLGRFAETLRLCGRAEYLFTKSSSLGYEQVTITVARAWALAFTGRAREAEVLTSTALAVEHPDGHAEALLEAAWLAVWFGPAGRSDEFLRRVQLERLEPGWMLHWLVVRLWGASNLEELTALLGQLDDKPTPTLEVGAAFRWHLGRAKAFGRLKEPRSAADALRLAESVAIAQGSPVQRRIVEIQRALLDTPEVTSSHVAMLPPEDEPLLGIYASEISERLGVLSPAAYDVVARTARTNPDRWRGFLRAALEAGGATAAERAAVLLEEIGDSSDVCLLRDYARRARRGSERWGDALARRLAPRLWIDDLGLATIQVGDRRIDGRTIRRRALELLLFLVGQPSGAATPDQLIEALWPDIDPEAALNSIHQTIYVLRRVFDPGYKGNASPEYLHFDSDMVRLDPQLVDCRSWLCLRLLSSREWTVQRVNDLVAAYRAPYAADFMYEEWASSYRDRLHALYLGAVEQAVSGQLGLGEARWRLWVGQQALLVDPDADTVEALVIGLYRAVEATSAAREQYAHYAAALREQLGIEPPQLEQLEDGIARTEHIGRDAY